MHSLSYRRNWEFRFLKERGNPEYQEKNLLEQRNNIYNLNPRMTSLPVFEPRPHWREASAVITLHQPCFPSLLKLATNRCVQYVELGKRLDRSFLITVNYLVSDHPSCTTKWLLTGRWSSMGKIKKKIQPELINVIT